MGFKISSGMLGVYALCLSSLTFAAPNALSPRDAPVQEYWPDGNPNHIPTPYDPKNVPSNNVVRANTPYGASSSGGGGGKASVSGGPIQVTGGTYPRAIVLDTGDVLMAYSFTEGGNNVINTQLSHDQGASWSASGQVVSGVGDITNPTLVQLKDKSILCAYRNHDKNGGAYTEFRITVSKSTDGGKSWKWLSQPACDPGPVNGNWEPFLRLDQSGNVQIYYAREVSGDNQDVLMRTSKDGGKSWSVSSVVAGANDDHVRDGMPGVSAYTANGQHCLFEVHEKSIGTFVVEGVTSSDDGKTWSHPFPVYTPRGSPKTNAQSPQVTTVDNTLYVSFMTNEDGTDVNTEAGRLVWSTGFGSGCSISGWSADMNVVDAPATWPGLLGPVGDHRFLFMYERSGVWVQPITTN